MSLRATSPYFLSVGLHALIVALLAFGTTFSRPPPQPPLPVEAVVVDQSVLEALAVERRQDERQRRQAAAERQRQQQAEAERQRAVQEQAELEAAQAAEVEAQQQARIQAQQRAETEARRRAEAERRQQADAAAAAKRKAEQQAAERRAREQAEARKKVEAEAAARRKADAEAQARAQREADLRARMAAEERRAAALSAGKGSQYAAMLQAHIERHWIRPPSARPGLDCEIRVRQIPGGEVVNATLGRCNGDEAVKQSIIGAVLRSSPLPVPSDPSLFERELVIQFVPKD